MKQLLWCLLLFTQCTLAQDDADLTGNPFLFKDWNNGIVRFSSGREVKEFKLKFDVYKNQLLLQFQGSTFAAESKVHEFVLLPRNKDSLVFRKGFTATDKTNANTFFQVVFKDKVQLLRLYSMNIIEEKTLVSNGKQHRRLEETETWYVYENNQLIEWPAFLKKETDMAAFIETQNLRMRSAEDYVAVARKYNEKGGLP